ncbi:MAG: precorrin-6y C5,15-methyltransferase (decarboxylating) subunit CbiE [Synergistaceae bacterium]|jgi:precorrin-6Y C5,15-methyltransferase (decarboxylating)|nr:precorrin-6y C5,15-methyltransferase (decarboxylating) subunit CbiE [Synergistaceae bacterium]
MTVKNRLYVVSVGPGDAEQLTLAAGRILKTSDCLVLAKRHLPLAGGHGNVELMGSRPVEAFPMIERRLSKGSVAVAVSGDAGVFSLLPRLREHFSDLDITVIPGVSSLQSLSAALCETWEDAEIVSVHGRDVSPSKVAGIVAHNRKTVFFCGPDRDPAWLCRVLTERGMNDLEVAVGERLSCPDGRVVRGSPSDLCGRVFDALSVVRVRNPEPLPPFPSRPEDEEFLRSGESARIPMTRGEVRTIVLDQLRLTPDSVVWDIGAGTGSVSVACARLCPWGDVHAVERSEDAAALLRRNREKFGAYNLWVHEGNAASLLRSLPRPTHVFVGGSGGELRRILEHVGGLGKLDQFGKSIRVVVSGVTLETICVAHEVLCGADFRGPDVLQVAVSRSRVVGNSVIMAAQNPVTLLSAWTRGGVES